jgi:hypothetical protein
VSKNPAGVALPVSADIPAEIGIAFIAETDEHAQPAPSPGTDGGPAHVRDLRAHPRSGGQRYRISQSSGEHDHPG